MTKFINTEILRALDMVSRLKGIETFMEWCWQYSSGLWICFPVWRELKLISLKKICTNSASCLWICFPVCRELKQTFYSYKGNTTAFGYAFPFEGNWNYSSIFPSFSPQFIFGYAFPFEGNWNWDVFIDIPIDTRLWICFPVWRELKLLSQLSSWF